MNARAETLFASLGFKPVAFEAIAVEGGLNVYAEWSSEQTAKSFRGVAPASGEVTLNRNPGSPRSRHSAATARCVSQDLERQGVTSLLDPLDGPGTGQNTATPPAEAERGLFVESSRLTVRLAELLSLIHLSEPTRRS
jgi:hypothetical protein